MAQPVYATEDLIVTTTDGRSVGSVPVQLVEGPVGTNVVGQPVDAWQVEGVAAAGIYPTDGGPAEAVAVRIVESAVSVNEVGKPVDAVPIWVTSGSLQPQPAAAQWYTPGAYASTDVQNGRFMVAGVEYASAAEMIAAGAATAVAGGGWNVVLPVGVTPGQISFVADAITSATPTPPALEYLVSVDDGGAVTGDEFAYVGRTTSNTMQSGVTTGSVSVATLALSAVAASTAVRLSGRFKANSFGISRDGGASVTDVAGGMPTVGRITIGNRYDGLRPWGGTINQVTVFIDREFTNPQAEIFSGVGFLRGLFNSWWNRWLTFTEAGKTYEVGMNSRDNRIYSVVMDGTTRKVLDAEPVTDANEVPLDDHSTGAYPGRLVLGRLMLLYGGHDDEGFLRFRRSSNDMPGNYAEEIQIPIGNGANVSYAQLMVNGSTLYAICQSGSNNFWDIFKSTDLGDTWVRKKRLVEGVGGLLPQYYLAFSAVNDGVASGYSQLHPANVQNQIRSCSLDLNTENLLTGGVVLGNINDGDNDVAITLISALELVRTPDTGHSQRLLDVSADGVDITIADTPDGWATCDYLLGRGGGSWTFSVVTAGSSFGAPNNVSYVGGMVFAQHPHSGYLLYSASAASGNNLLQQQASPDGVTFTPTTIFNGGATKVMRPHCPYGATSALAVMVQSGTYDDFNNATVDTRVFAAAA